MIDWLQFLVECFLECVVGFASVYYRICSLIPMRICLDNFNNLKFRELINYYMPNQGTQGNSCHPCILLGYGFGLLSVSLIKAQDDLLEAPNSKGSVYSLLRHLWLLPLLRPALLKSACQFSFRNRYKMQRFVQILGGKLDLSNHISVPLPQLLKL